MDPRILIITGIVTFALTIITYYDLAISKSWSIGAFYYPHRFKYIKIFILISGIYFCIAGAIDFGWYYLLIIPVFAFIISKFLLDILKSNTQVISIIGYVLLFLTNILMQIEVVSL